MTLTCRVTRVYTARKFSLAAIDFIYLRILAAPYGDTHMWLPTVERETTFSELTTDCESFYLYVACNCIARNGPCGREISQNQKPLSDRRSDVMSVFIYLNRQFLNSRLSQRQPDYRFNQGFSNQRAFILALITNDADNDYVHAK